MVGDIYLAKIYFTDLSAHKLRPVLVIKELDDDCMCLQLTTQAKIGRLTIGQQDLVKGGVKKDSFVIMPKNFTLHKSILVKYLATLKPELTGKITREFCLAMNCI